MMKSKLKMLGAVLAIASLSACSSMNSTYKIKSEKGNVVDKVILVHGQISMSLKLTVT